MQSNLSFRLMSLEFGVRDLFRPPTWILEEAGVRTGMTIVDFGCGPGSFTLAAARLVGPRGFVYAVDVHPLAAASVRNAIQKGGFRNVQMILGESMTDIPDGIADMSLLYDVLHNFEEPDRLLIEQHRVLKPEGTLSVMDHHIEEALLPTIPAERGRFRLIRKSRWTFEFNKAEMTVVAL